MTTFISIAALIIGSAIGAAFALVQEAARRRNEKLQREGKINSGWAVMPGSGKRIASLLIVLVAVQLFCPLLFKDGVQWWVSAGVTGGYGCMLFVQLRQRLARTK